MNWTPWNNKADDYQIRDDVSWTKGRHQFKFGGSWAIYKKVQDWFKNTEGNLRIQRATTPATTSLTTSSAGQNYTEDAIKAAATGTTSLGPISSRTTGA